MPACGRRDCKNPRCPMTKTRTRMFRFMSASRRRAPPPNFLPPPLLALASTVFPSVVDCVLAAVPPDSERRSLRSASSSGLSIATFDRLSASLLKYLRTCLSVTTRPSLRICRTLSCAAWQYGHRRLLQAQRPVTWARLESPKILTARESRTFFLSARPSPVRRRRRRLVPAAFYCLIWGLAAPCLTRGEAQRIRPRCWKCH